MIYPLDIHQGGGPAKFLALPPTVCIRHTPGGGPAKFLALPPTVCIRHTPGGGRALTSSRACAMKCQENKKYAVGRIYNPWENFEACTVALEQHDIKC